MIAFRDFRSSNSGSPLSDGMDKAIVSANEWLEKTKIQPINIETLTEFPDTRSASTVDRGIRVWYEIAPSR